MGRCYLQPLQSQAHHTKQDRLNSETPMIDFEHQAGADHDAAQGKDYVTAAKNFE